MAVILIIVLIVLGLALIVVEVVVLPGITVAGIGGVIMAGLGVYLTFSNYGNMAGTYTLMGVAFLFILFLIYALRAKTWDKLSLHSEIDSKIEADIEDIRIGDTAVTVSRLAPIGKIMIHQKIVEGKSEFGLIDENTEVEVVHIDHSTIIVQKINQL